VCGCTPGSRPCAHPNWRRMSVQAAHLDAVCHTGNRLRTLPSQRGCCSSSGRFSSKPPMSVPGTHAMSNASMCCGARCRLLCPIDRGRLNAAAAASPAGYTPADNHCRLRAAWGNGRMLSYSVKRSSQSSLVACSRPTGNDLGWDPGSRSGRGGGKARFQQMDNSQVHVERIRAQHGSHLPAPLPHRTAFVPWTQPPV
jgi:hypothetical protein